MADKHCGGSSIHLYSFSHVFIAIDVISFIKYYNMVAYYREQKHGHFY